MLSKHAWKSNKKAVFCVSVGETVPTQAPWVCWCQNEVWLGVIVPCCHFRGFRKCFCLKPAKNSSKVLSRGSVPSWEHKWDHEVGSRVNKELLRTHAEICSSNPTHDKIFVFFADTVNLNSFNSTESFQMFILISLLDAAVLCMGLIYRLQNIHIHTPLTPTSSHTSLYLSSPPASAKKLWTENIIKISIMSAYSLIHS